jgi:hypothetical protein
VVRGMDSNKRQLSHVLKVRRAEAKHPSFHMISKAIDVFIIYRKRFTLITVAIMIVDL